MQFEITPTKYSNSIQVQSNEDNQEIFTYFQLKNQDSILPIARLNSGIRNRQNFFPWTIFLFQKIITDSVNCADSKDTKILAQFPGNSILEYLELFPRRVAGMS